MSLFMALYGYHPPSITLPLRGKPKFQPVEDHIKHYQHVIHILKDNLTIEKNRMKQQADEYVYTTWRS
jgi:hypothetical protein